MTAIQTLVCELFLLCFVLCFVSCDKEPWYILPNNTGDFCPTRDICIWEHQHEPETNPARGRSCCTDCSCERTCGKEKTCCFPELDITNGKHRQHKACLQTSEPEFLKNKHLFIHYLMVDSNPDDGCIVDVPEIPEGEQCGNVAVEFGGTKYPAYSKLNNTIYKNMLCAQCHNSTDAQLTQVSLHNCQMKTFLDAMVSNRNMFHEFGKRGCYISFDFSDAHLKYEQCYVNVVDTYGSTRTISNLKFTIILDPYVTAAIGASLTSPRQIYKKVCFLKEQQVECRWLLCPKEMVLVNGVCTFMSQRLVDYPYVLSLKLIPDNDVNIEIDDLLDEISNHNKVVSRHSSWSKKWKIVRLFTKDNTYASNSTLVTEIIVRMTYRSKNTNPVKLLDSIQASLKISRFMLTVGNMSYGFRQTLSEYYQFTRYPSIDGFGSSIVHTISNIRSMSNQTVLHKIYKEDLFVEISSAHFPIVYGGLVEITQTQFCDLVKLNEDEYLMHAFSIVYYELLDKYFIDRQFDITIDENGEPVVKICLSESGFRVTNNVAPTAFIICRDFWTCMCYIWSSILVLKYKEG